MKGFNYVLSISNFKETHEDIGWNFKVVATHIILGLAKMHSIHVGYAVNAKGDKSLHIGTSV